MPLCQVDLAGETLADPAGAERSLARGLSRLAPGAPVIVLIHGYKFSPFVAGRSPHDHILALDPARRCRKALSWPRALGLGAGRADEPLCLALGWHARGTLWQAYRQAAAAGRGLARLVEILRRRRPGRPVEVLAHSLGARVALSALPHAEAGALGRAVLLAPAEMQSRAQRRLATPAGRALEVVNVTSRENAVYDRALEWLVAPHLRGDRALGRGLGQPGARWLDLAIDDAATRAALAQAGFPVAAPDRRVCHWSVYLRPGLFPVYRAVLAGQLPLAPLRAALPGAPAPCRSRPGQGPAPALPSAVEEAS